MRTLSRQEEQILLVIYQLKNDAYLVSIRDKLKDLTGKYFDVGTIYVPLKRLNQEGFLESFLGKPTALRGGKAIKYYQLTQKGFNALAEIKKIQKVLWQGFVNPITEN